MKILLTILSLLVSSLSFSQEINCVVVDSETNLPIPYCTLFSVFYKEPQYADEMGHLVLKKEIKDSVIIHHTGYFDTIISIISLKDSIKLRKKYYQLPEIRIKKFSKEYKFGSFEYKKMNRFHYWISAEFLRRIDLDTSNKIYKLYSIFIPMGFNKDYEDSCLCKVHLYRFSKETGLVDILKNSVILNRKNIPKDFYIDVSDQDVFIEDSVLFVGLDCFLNIPFKVKNDYLNFNNEKHKAYLKHYKSSPIWFYFKSKQLKSNIDSLLSFERKKEGIYIKSKNDKWLTSFFPAGIVVKSY